MIYKMAEKFQFAKLTDDAILPQRADDGAAGYDLRSTETLILPPKSKAMVSTGIAFSIPANYYGRVAPRSGLAAKYSIDVLAGVIDASYRGEIKVILYNLGNSEFEIQKGDRIAQMIITPIVTPEFEEVPYEELTQTERGAGGFGSTGVQ